jgi:hypothetical protein
MILVLLDVSLTYQGIVGGYLEEANPLVAYLIVNRGIGSAMLLSGGVRLLALTIMGKVSKITWVAIALMFIAVIHVVIFLMHLALLG